MKASGMAFKDQFWVRIGEEDILRSRSDVVKGF